MRLLITEFCAVKLPGQRWRLHRATCVVSSLFFPYGCAKQRCSKRPA